ncbi:hypothetical protein Ahy_B05g076700 [Arachis hypogaea]|uniref:Transposase MuDR plant domain-containing protein n=1 Tax=Arachis hypogaea TaxID=3818 RepID=A0A444Z3X0_ARAHY|nr:hypothetical protein Ahy_B05g076700 [Arachis hypogaea]
MNEKKRCRVICYDPDCPWLCYCARTNYPASFQIKTFVDEHTCPRSNKNKTCPEKEVGTATEEPDLDEEEAREQEANWEETMEAAHATHVADEEDLTQNHP